MSEKTTEQWARDLLKEAKEGADPDDFDELADLIAEHLTVLRKTGHDILADSLSAKVVELLRPYVPGEDDA